ncbi:MAG: hypothetical protein U0263_17400 [Polyangiaceae bacterium]
MNSGRPSFGLVAATLALTLLAPSLAKAEPDARGTDVLLSMGVSYRKTTAIDLAAIGGSEDYGTGNDASPGSLSFEVGGGLVFDVPLELRASAWLGVGGLALAHIEERYFGVDPEPIGSSLTVGAGGSLRYSEAVLPSLRLFAGPAIDTKRLAASSPAGATQLDLVGFGLDAGARFRTGSVSRSIGGHLELTLSARRELPVALWAGRSRDDVLFRGVGGNQDPIYSFGVGAAWIFAFENAL